jgi:hypothetical protein
MGFLISCGRWARVALLGRRDGNDFYLALEWDILFNRYVRLLEMEDE